MSGSGGGRPPLLPEDTAARAPERLPLRLAPVSPLLPLPPSSPPRGPWLLLLRLPLAACGPAWLGAGSAPPGVTGSRGGGGAPVGVGGPAPGAGAPRPGAGAAGPRGVPGSSRTPLSVWVPDPGSRRRSRGFRTTSSWSPLQSRSPEPLSSGPGFEASPTRSPRCPPGAPAGVRAGEGLPAGPNPRGPAARSAEDTRSASARAAEAERSRSRSQPWRGRVPSGLLAGRRRGGAAPGRGLVASQAFRAPRARRCSHASGPGCSACCSSSSSAAPPRARARRRCWALAEKSAVVAATPLSSSWKASKASLAAAASRRTRSAAVRSRTWARSPRCRRPPAHRAAPGVAPTQRRGALCASASAPPRFEVRRPTGGGAQPPAIHGSHGTRAACCSKPRSHPARLLSLVLLSFRRRRLPPADLNFFFGGTYFFFFFFFGRTRICFSRRFLFAGIRENSGLSSSSSSDDIAARD